MTLFALILPFGLLFLLIFIIGIFAASYKHNNMKNYAKYVFYYLLALVALAFTAVSVGLVVFAIINQTLASPWFYSDSNSSLRFAISALLIATPIFFVTTSLIFKGLRKGELEIDSPARRWLTYLILFVSAVTILGVLIAVMNNFLSGDFTARFILQMLTVILIAGIIFSFYLYDIRRDNPQEGGVVIKAFFWGALVLILASFVAAWFFVESPSVTRAKKLDNKMINSISMVENSINSFYEDKGRLPQDLAEIQSSRYVYFSDQDLVDSDSGLPLVYEPSEGGDYKLCATFRTDTNNPEADSNQTYRYDNRRHDAGYYCFDLSVWNTRKGEPILLQ